MLGAQEDAVYSNPISHHPRMIRPERLSRLHGLASPILQRVKRTDPLLRHSHTQKTRSQVALIDLASLEI